ncbi:MAG: hypothetical protein NZ455_08845 [Bacteroidia bacterium]|nr:hypothetical protein [Bacteroidia bacterium]
MRRACVSTVLSPSPTLSLLPRGWVGRSTEAIAQPAVRRPEAQRRDTPKNKYLP